MNCYSDKHQLELMTNFNSAPLLNNTAVFDIDNTLVFNPLYVDYLSQSHDVWDSSTYVERKYYLVDMGILHNMNRLAYFKERGYDVVALTSRPVGWFSATKTELEGHGINVSHIYMNYDGFPITYYHKDKEISYKLSMLRELSNRTTIKDVTDDNMEYLIKASAILPDTNFHSYNRLTNKSLDIKKGVIDYD
jgi:hypothetical protein